MTPTIIAKQKGSGDLVLKNGARQVVIWEIEILSDGSIRKGAIHGGGKHLATAAKDGCANLFLGLEMTAAIAIDGCNDDQASFTVLLISSEPRLFPAQTIGEAGPVLEKSLFSIGFSNAEEEHLTVTVPTIVLSDFLPILQNLVTASSPAPGKTTFTRRPKTWKTGSLASGSVSIVFDDDVPVALVPQDARELAAELIEFANRVESLHDVAH